MSFQLVSALQPKALAGEVHVSGPLTTPGPWPRGLFMGLPHLQGHVPTHPHPQALLFSAG